VRGGVGPSAEQPALVISVQQGSGEPGWASGLAPATSACSLLVTLIQPDGTLLWRHGQCLLRSG
jgi:hypothetical protein